MNKGRTIRQWKGKADIRKIGAAIVASILVVAMVVGLWPSSTLAAKTSDYGTETKYSESLGDNASTENAGRIWTDKSVYSDASKTFEVFGGGTETIDNDSDFLIAYSALATSQAIQGQTQAPVDVVFIIDLSGSMSNEDSEMNNGYSRIYNTVQAVNTSIEKVMAMNEYTRVAVVGFSTTAQVLLPLDRYTKSTSTEREWVPNDPDRWWEGGEWVETTVESDYFSLNRNTASSNNATLYTRATASDGSRITRDTSVSGGTNIQMGLYTGMNVLASATSTTANINGSNVTRVPSVILLSDGAPTYSSESDDWWAPSNTNRGSGSSAYAGNGMSAIMTGAYMKDAIDRKYGVATTVYTVGMGITGLNGDQEDLAYITLDPETYWDANNDMAEDISNAWDTYVGNNNTGRPSLSVGGGDGNYTFAHPNTGYDIDSAKDYVDDYYDADNASAVTDVFDQIVANISISAPQVPTELKGTGTMSDDGFITYTDPIGEYMEVKDVKAILYAGEKFVYDPNDSESVVTNGNITTYKFKGEVHSPVYGDQNISDVQITVETKEDGNQVLTVKIPASVIPLRVNTVLLNADGTVKSHTNNGAYPIRVLYTVGVKENIKSNGVVSTSELSLEYLEANTNNDGTINFYSNLYTGENVVNGKTAGNATVEFEPSHTNPFYYMLENEAIYYKNEQGELVQVPTTMTIEDDDIYYYQMQYYHGTAVEVEKTQRTGAQLKRTDIIAVDGYWYRAAGSPRLNRILEFEGTKIDNNTKTAEDFYAPTFEYAEGSTDAYDGKFVVYLGNNGVLSMAGSGSIEITKTVTTQEGVTAPDKDFTFTVDLNGTATLSGTFRYIIENAAGESVSSGTISDGGTIALKAGQKARIIDLPPGTTYTVTETELAGFAATVGGEDTNVATGTIESGQTKTAAFANHYTVTSITVPASDGFQGEKVISGREWNDEDTYTFELVPYDNAPVPAKTLVTVTKADMEAGKVLFSFGNVTYDIPGVYKYVIEEKDPATADDFLPGISYSQAVYELDVTVVNNGNGTMSATTVMTQVVTDAGVSLLAENTVADKVAVFTNIYSATAVEFGPMATKNYTDNTGERPLENGMFTFELTPVDDAKMPEGVSTITATNVGTEVYFERITYKQEDVGTHRYKITEKIPAGANAGNNYTVNGMTYDASEQYVTVTVSLNGNRVVASASYDNGESRAYFTNTYAPAAVTKEMIGEKTLVGRDMNETFTFNIEAANAATGLAVRNGYVAFAEDYEASVSGGKAGEAVAFSFGNVTFTKPGVYTFAISEEKGTAAAVDYDDHIAYVTVTVTDNQEGALEATVVYDNGEGGDTTKAVFVNTYEPTFDMNTAVDLYGTKNLTGKSLLAGEFYFEVEDVNNDTTVLRTHAVDETAENGVYSASITLLEDVTYTQAGTYVYLIREQIPEPKVKGTTYDETVYKLTVTVTDNIAQGELEVTSKVFEVSKDHGTSWAPATTENAVFTNTYVPTPTTTAVPVSKKVIEGTRTEVADGEFAFELSTDETDGIILPTDTVETNDADGNIQFDEIEFTKAGVYTVEIREVVPANPENGMQYSPQVISLTYRVTDDRNGNLTATLVGAHGGNTFTNIYIAEGTLNFTLTKQLTGREWKDSDSFDFEVVVLDPVTQAAIDAGEIVFPADGDAIQKVTLTKAEQSKKTPNITFYREGTYKFIIREVTTNKISGIHYDATPRTVVVTTEDKGNGVIEAKYIIEDNLTLTFSNRYDTTSTELNGHDNLTVTKEFTGRQNDTWLDSDKFTFTLGFASGKDAAGNPIANADLANYVQLPANTTLEVTNANKAHSHFGNIIFKEAGTYKFTVTEEKSGIPGVTDDSDKDRTIVVEVTDDTEGNLVARVVENESEALVFKNTYSVAETTLDGATNLIVRKVLAGRDWFDTDAFTFTLGSAGAITSEAITTGKVVLPANATGITIKKTNNGEAAFGDIVFKEEGIYAFLIKETDENADNPKIKYDSHTATVIVTVTDNNQGQLVATVTNYIGAMTFENVYTPDPITEVLAGQKVIDGRTLNASDHFRFHIEKAADSPADTPMPAVTTVANNVDGEIKYAAIVFTKAGTYKYEISEIQGTIAGIKYDTGKVEATVEVTYDSATGELEADVTYRKVGGNGGTGFTFTNVYETNPTDQVPISASKTVTPSEGNMFTMNGEEFQFEIEPSGANPDSDPIDRHFANNTKEGLVVFDNAVYTEPGTYVYTVHEVGGTRGGIHYDESVYTITVTVTDDESIAKLEADVVITKAGTEVDAIEFNNGYDPEEATAVIHGHKNLNGGHKNLEDGEFTFKLTALTDGAPMPAAGEEEVKNEETGLFQFGIITYDRTGTYEYEITEVIGDVRGYTYDTTKHKVTVTVTDEGGVLKATVSDLTTVIFNNTYIPGSTKVTLNGTKKLEGRSLKEKEFAFTLLDSDGKEVATAWNDEKGAFEFAEVMLTKAGTHTFTIVEKDTNVGGVTYDTSSYAVEVIVEDHAGQLEVISTNYYKADEKAAVVFNNTYKAGPTSIQLSALKKLEGRALKAGEFRFILEDENGNKLYAVNAADGTILFEAIEYSEAGTYVYKISEEKGTLDGVAYDETVYTVTVVVEDDLSGRLKATVSEDSKTPVFTNTYEESKVSVATGDYSGFLPTVIMMMLAVGFIAMSLRKRREV